MKAKKKPLGMKQKKREERKREERIAVVVTITVLIIIISVSGFLVYSMLDQPSTNQPVNSTSEPRAAIVDQLSLTYPNQTFIETATNNLKQAGYIVDYYPGENVTVEFYRNLSTHDYGIVILREHSAVTVGKTWLGLFTSELYDKSKHVYEQLTDQVGKASYSKEEEDKGISYFSIHPQFVTQSMQERFQNTIIVMMGCNGLKYTDMAKAFIKNGAKVYIGYNGSVAASYTDQATTHLLQHFLTEELTLKKSVQETFVEIGADPSYNSLLIYYPLEAGEYTVQNTVSNLVTADCKRTKLMQQSVFQSVADRDGMLQSGMEQGVNESYERLDELLKKMTDPKKT